MLKRKILLLLILLLLTLCACSSDISSNQTENDTSSSQTEEKSQEELLQEIMDDGIIQETNAQEIENALKSIEDYYWWDDHSLTQSSINKEWSVYCANNEYNTYTKSYELSAHDDLEIKYAHFQTYDFDYDYLSYCASLFDTSLINTEEVQQWMQEFKIEDGTVEKVFGDATFTMEYFEYDDGESYVGLTIWACGDINSK